MPAIRLINSGSALGSACVPGSALRPANSSHTICWQRIIASEASSPRFSDQPCLARMANRSAASINISRSFCGLAVMTSVVR